MVLPSVRTCLIIGGAATVWADVALARELGEFSGVVACNDIGAEWDGALDGWVTLHPTLFRQLVPLRAQRGLPAAKALYTYTQAVDGLPDAERATLALTECKFPGQIHSGSSGLFAAKVALDDLGFDRGILCGIPMDGPAAHFDRPGEEWPEIEGMRVGWREALPAIKDRLRSMSGFTAKILGRPTPGWVAGGDGQR